jgi:Protein of unknown function (DUF3089)
MRRLLVLAGLVAGGIIVPAGAHAADRTVWLCRPGAASDPCRGSLTATVIQGSKPSIERTAIPSHPPIDCFYVYPTVSDQKTANATLHIDPEERSIAAYQAQRFSQDCRIWAPMYRQITLRGIADPASIPASAATIAYADVRAAWREYLARHNHGRGVVLIGHSQGTFMLKQLIAQEIDGKPAIRRRLVSAILLGGNVTVRTGTLVGGDFRHVPGCRSDREIGCVVAYSMFGATPPADALFGRVAGVDAGGSSATREVLCVNPAALGGGSGTLKPYSLTAPFHGTLGAATTVFTGPLPDVSTPWVRPPGRYTARCSHAGGADVLLVRAEGGAHMPPPTPTPSWGLHLGDVNLALGNLTDLVRRQAAAYART